MVVVVQQIDIHVIAINFVTQRAINEAGEEVEKIVAIKKV